MHREIPWHLASVSKYMLSVPGLATLGPRFAQTGSHEEFFFALFVKSKIRNENKKNEDKVVASFCLPPFHLPCAYAKVGLLWYAGQR